LGRMAIVKLSFMARGLQGFKKGILSRNAKEIQPLKVISGLVWPPVLRKGARFLGPVGNHILLASQEYGNGGGLTAVGD